MEIDLTTIQARKALVAPIAAYVANPTLDTALVCALIEHESAWSPFAVRYEPGFYTRYVLPQVDSGQLKSSTEAQLRAVSFGLMQIMGQTAREFGFAGRYLTELCDPKVGVTFGCKKLAWCMKEHSGDLRVALLSYNGGGDPKYPDLVLQYLAKYQ